MSPDQDKQTENSIEIAISSLKALKRALNKEKSGSAKESIEQALDRINILRFSGEKMLADVTKLMQQRLSFILKKTTEIEKDINPTNISRKTLRAQTIERVEKVLTDLKRINNYSKTLAEIHKNLASMN